MRNEKGNKEGRDGKNWEERRCNNTAIVMDGRGKKAQEGAKGIDTQMRRVSGEKKK